MEIKLETIEEYIDMIQEELTALRAALLPFAKAAVRINYFDGEEFDAPLFAYKDDCLTELLVDDDRITVSHLRAALEAYNG